jgi:hypothetical protein
MKTVCCLSKESAKIESVLEVDILCSPVSKKPRYEQPTFDSYDDDDIFLPGLNLERKLVFSNEEQFCLVGQKLPLGMSFKDPLYLIIMETMMKMLRCFFEAKSISIQPSDENQRFCQEQHVKEKQPSINIHEDISCHQLADVIRADQGEVDQHPASAFHSPVLSTDIQPRCEQL